jgi:hypothetical protein
MVYIPRQEIMLKLMRACIGCKTKEDLWIHLINDIGINLKLTHCEHKKECGEHDHENDSKWI